MPRFSRRCSLMALAAVLVLAGCGADGSDSPATTESTAATTESTAATTESTAATTESTAATSDSGETWVIGTGVGAPPYEFYEGNDTTTIQGFEPDLLRAVAEREGVNLDWQVTEFESLFSSLDSGRFDFLAYGLADRRSRQEKYDLLDYVKNEQGFMGKTETDPAVEMVDLCGKSVAALAGSVVESQLMTESEGVCVDAGLEPIEILPVQNQSGIVQAVTTGRTDYASADVPLLAYEAQQVGGLEVFPLTYLEGFTAMVFPKDSELSTRIAAAIDELIADGTYAQILSEWDLESLALEETEFNAGTAD
jgi:polar amino acid transport system substrate-binding protein